MSSTARHGQCLPELTPEMRSELIELFSRQDVKDFIVEVLITNVRSVIEMTRCVLRSDPMCNEALLQHEVFVWDLERFKQRLLPVEYVNVLHLEATETIVLTKIMTDLYWLDYYLGMIEQQKLEAVQQQLRSCQALLTIRQDLTTKYHFNVCILHDLENRLQSFGVEKMAAMTTKSFEYDQFVRRCIDQKVHLPVRMRYVKKTQASHIEVAKHFSSEREQKLRWQTLFYRRAILDSDETTNSTIQHYKLQIQDYKEKIKYWHWRYEHEFEQMNSKSTYFQSSIKELERRWQLCRRRKSFLLEYVVEIKMHEEKEQRRQWLKAMRLRKKIEEELDKKALLSKIAARKKAAKAAKAAQATKAFKK